MNSSETLSVAISGCHRQVTKKIGAHNFATFFDAVPETRISAVFDLGPETKEEFVNCWGDVAAYDNYGQMLDESKPDIICIATSHKMHADQVEAAVASGVRGIIVDKPLVPSLTELDRIVNACRDGNVPFVLALDRRWWPGYNHVRNAIRDGIIGDVISVSHFGLPNLINHGSHTYDALLMVLGDPEPASVSGFVEDLSDEPLDSRKRLDPSGNAEIVFSNGVRAWVAKAHGRLRFDFHVLGTEGHLIILEDATKAFVLRQESGSESVTPPEPLSIPATEEGWPAGPAMVRDLVNAIRSGGRTACDIEHARRTTEIGFAIHESSAREGAVVSLPLENRSRRIESFPWGNE